MHKEDKEGVGGETAGEKKNGRNAQKGRLEQISDRDGRCSQIKGQKSLTILSQL